MPRISGAVLAGLLYWIAYPGQGLWPAAFVAYVPLLLALRGQSAVRVLALGVVAGTVASLLGFAWLPATLRRFLGIGVSASIGVLFLVSLFNSGRFALFAWLLARGSNAGIPHHVMANLAFVASELCYPLLFPWYLGAAVHDVTPLVQAAELGGVVAVGLVSFWANVGLAESLRYAAIHRRMSRTGITYVLMFLLAWGFGALRMRAVDKVNEHAPSATVGVAQANLKPRRKWDEPNVALRQFERLSRLARDRGADFLVWSESALAWPVPELTMNEFMRSRVGSWLGVPAIVGATVVRAGSAVAKFNSALAIDDRGYVTARYDKRKLFPIGEYLPFEGAFPRLRAVLPRAGTTQRGTSSEPLVLQIREVKHAIRALICYEDVIPELAQSSSVDSVELLVSLSDDGWFESPDELAQHAALSKLRAVEHRRYLVRSANSGLSSIVDPVGRTTVAAPALQEALLVGTIQWIRTVTPYEAWGDAPWQIVALAAVALALLPQTPRRPLTRSRPLASPPP